MTELIRKMMEKSMAELRSKASYYNYCWFGFRLARAIVTVITLSLLIYQNRLVHSWEGNFIRKGRDEYFLPFTLYTCERALRTHANVVTVRSKSLETPSLLSIILSAVSKDGIPCTGCSRYSAVIHRSEELFW